MHFKEKVRFRFFTIILINCHGNTIQEIPKTFANLASSICWHHLNKVWCELRDSSRKNRQ